MVRITQFGTDGRPRRATAGPAGPLWRCHHQQHRGGPQRRWTDGVVCPRYRQCSLAQVADGGEQWLVRLGFDGRCHHQHTSYQQECRWAHEVFARGTDNAVWHQWQTSAPATAGLAGLPSGGVITSNIAVGRNADGRIEVLVRGSDNALWHKWQTARNNGWSGWASMGGVITSDPVVINNFDGRLEVFARGTDNAVWHRWQIAPSNGWSGWASLGGSITSNIAAQRNADGRLEVFVRGTDLAVWHRWQTAPNNGWS